MSVVKLDIEYFPLPNKGKPIANGFVYVGNPNTDPTVPANQKSITVRDESGVETAVSQPVSLGAGGVPVYNGSPVQILVDGDYSLLVQDSLEVQIYYVDSALSLLAESTILTYDTVVDLQAAQTAAGAAVYLKGNLAAGDDGEGVFNFKTGNWSALVTLDTCNMVAVAPGSDLTGASGVWLRDVAGGIFDFKWTLPAIDGATDDVTEVECFYDVVNYFNGTGIFPAGEIYAGSLITKALSNCKFIGAGKATILTGDFGYALLKLLDVDNVTFEGIFFRNDYVNAVLDQGTATVYSFQNNVKDLSFINCKFSNTDSNNPALALYTRITVVDVGATIDGFKVENCEFVDVGGIACSVMNRGEVAGVGQYAACIGVDFSGNYGYNCGTQSSFGFLLTLDGYGVGTTVRDNRCGKMLGIGIENTGHINAIFENNTFFDHSTSYSPMSFSGAPFSGSSTRHTMTGNRIANNVVEGASLAASNFVDVSDSTFDSNYFEATGTPAATLRGSNNRLFGEVYVSDHNFAVQVGDATLTTKGNIFDTCTCDNSASVANFYALLFLGTLTTDNQFVNARLLKGTGGGFTVAQTTSASNNVVWNYNTATISANSAEKIIALPDADYVLSDNDEAIIAYDAIEFTGTLTVGRTVDFPVALFVKPKQIKNSSGQILTFSVDGTSGGTLANGATGVLIYKPSTGAPDVW